MARNDHCQRAPGQRGCFQEAGRKPTSRAADVIEVKTEVPDDSEDHQRQELLSVLFGPHVPAVLEGQLLRTSDVAVLFEVSERTVSEWAKKGQIPSVRTPGGQRRYPAEGIRTVLARSRNGLAKTSGR
jgi:excisionase family DNA binding protein